MTSRAHERGKSAIPHRFIPTPLLPPSSLIQPRCWTGGTYSGGPSGLRNFLWQATNSTRVLVMREKANIGIAASLFCCKMLIFKSLVLCVSPALRKKGLHSCKCRTPTYPVKESEVQIPLAISFLQWELLVMKPAALFAHGSTYSSQCCPQTQATSSGCWDVF